MTTETDLRLVYSVAHSFRRSTGMDLDELIAEASLAFVEACLKWNPQKAPLSSFSVLRMTNHLTDWLDGERERKRHEQKLPEGEDENDEDPIPSTLHLLVTPERLVDFKQRLNMASCDGKEVCKIIFESPGEFMDMAKSRKAKGWLKKALRAIGWSWPRIWRAFREVENIVDGEVPQE